MNRSFILLLVLVGIGCNRTPAPPEISLTGIDPLVAEQISNATREVKAAPRSDAAWGKLGMVLKAGGFSEATDCFAQAEKFNPKDPRWPYFQDGHDGLQRSIARGAPEFVRIRLGQVFLESGRLSEAEEQFRAAKYALGLGQVAHARGRWQEAIPHLQKARENKFTAQTATALLASANLRLGRTNEAQALSAEAAEMSADPPWPNTFEAELRQLAIGKRAWMEQAQEALGRRDLPTAGPIIDRLITHYPNASEGWLYLGRACVIQSNFVTAEQALSRHLQLDPFSVDGHLQMGLVRYNQDRLAEAEGEFQSALKAKPDSHIAHYFLGQLYRRRGDNEAAVRSFKEALRCEPGFEPARHGLKILGVNASGG